MQREQLKIQTCISKGASLDIQIISIVSYSVERRKKREIVTS